MGDGSVYRILVERFEEKRPLGGARSRWKNNIKREFTEIGIDEANLIWLAQDRAG
jgi:hypothetical protein